MTGDYILFANQFNVAVERKATLNELCHNLMSRDRGRFYREIRRAKAEGTHLYIVCEHGKGIETIEDVAKWKNPYGRITGKMLREAIYKCAIAYGCEFIFCTKRQTGRIIVDILTNGRKTV